MKYFLQKYNKFKNLFAIFKNWQILSKLFYGCLGALLRSLSEGQKIEDKLSSFCFKMGLHRSIVKTLLFLQNFIIFS